MQSLIMIGSSFRDSVRIESTSVNTASTPRYIAQMFDLKLSFHPPLFCRTLVYSYGFPLRSCCLIAATSRDNDNRRVTLSTVGGRTRSQSILRRQTTQRV